MKSEVVVHGRPTKWPLLSPHRSAAPVPASLPVWHSSIGWILLLPMLYLAANGNITLGVNAVATTTEGGGGEFILA
jgi:hypothetical protein